MVPRSTSSKKSSTRSSRSSSSSTGNIHNSTTTTTMPPLRLLLAAALLAILGGARRVEAGGSVASNLRPASDLTSNCLGFPARNFMTNSSSVAYVYGKSPILLHEIGDAAIDFTLHDTRGQAWNLREKLEAGGGKPVVLIWGMYTCPAFQGMGTDSPWDKCGYRDEYDLVETHRDRVTFVHVYGAEPHPKLPGTNFDSGGVVVNYWSTVSQPETYEQRLTMVERVQDLIHPDQVILPDYLPGNSYSDLIQPVWCSYALGARPSVVISPDGSITFQQEWLQTVDLAGHLNVLLGLAPDGDIAGGGGGNGSGDASVGEDQVEIRVDGPARVGGEPGPAVGREGQRKEHGGGQS